MRTTWLRLLGAGLATLLVCASPALSTTVIPMTFDELVSTAQAIFLGEAVQVRSDWETSSQGRHIVTTVTFKVERVLKGDIGSEVRLQFLGGEIAGLVMEVDQMPRFEVGSRDVLFVSGLRNAVSPLVGFSSGRFRVTADRSGNASRVTTHDGRPVAAAASATSRTRSLQPRPSATTTYAEFEALVLGMLARTERVDAMSTATRVRVLLTAVALALGAGAVAGYFIPNPERTWPDGNISVHTQLTGGPAGTLIDGSSSLNVAFEDAIQTWNQYLGRIQFVPVRNSSSAIGDNNDVNNVILSDTAFGRAFDANTLAITSRWFDTRTNRRVEFDVVLNSRWSWNSYRGPLRAGVEDVVRVGLHELGLALGLSSPEADGQTVPAIMNSTVSDLDTLTFDDISGALTLYSAATAAPGAFRHITTKTDATGTATFTVAPGRTVPVRFVDHGSGSGIPGADAYLFTGSDGVAMAGMMDPAGRYFTQLAPIRLPVTVTGAVAAQVRPIDVPVPLVHPQTPAPAPNVIVDWIADNGGELAWNDVQRRAADLMHSLRRAEVIVDRQVTWSELADGPQQMMIDRGWDKIDPTQFMINTLMDRRGRAVGRLAGRIFGKLFYPAEVAVAARDASWQLVKAHYFLEGYGPNQRFNIRVVRLLPFTSAGADYTEWKVSVTPVEEPETLRPAGGVITGTLVDSRGNPLRGEITFSGPGGWARTNGAGYFATQVVPAGAYTVFGHAVGYHDGSTALTVRGDGSTEHVTIALTPKGIKKIVIELPTTQRIRDNQITSFRATVIRPDDTPYSPTPRLFWQSDADGVAAIDMSTGFIRAIKPGRASITASFDGYVSNVATVIVERTTPCPYALSATRFTATENGGTANVTVTTEADCAWTAVPSPTSMMSVISGGSGPGTGTFRLSVSRNTSTAPRTGLITVQSMPVPNTVTVTQAGTATAACPVTLSRSSVSVSAASNTGLSVGVTAATGCAWVATPASSFITVTSGSPGSGPGTVIFSVAANTGAARTGTLTINGQVLTVSQAAGDGGGTTATTLTGSIQCVRRNLGGFNNTLTCSGTLSIRLGTGFTSGTQYLGIFLPTDWLRTQSFTAGAVGSTVQVSATGSTAMTDVLPPCPSTQTSVTFFRSPLSGQAVATGQISVPVTCS